MEAVKQNMFKTQFSNEKVIESRPILESLSKEENSVKKNLGKKIFQSDDEEEEEEEE